MQTVEAKTGVVGSEDARVSAVIVTYGNRTDFLRKAVTGALANDVERVIVVNNAGAEVTAADFPPDAPVSILRCEHNFGSAGGFARGMREAVRDSGIDFVWLLDDDNVPADGSLAHLLQVYGEAAEHGVALIPASYRPARPEHRWWLENADTAEAVATSNACCGFSLSELRKLIPGFREKARSEAASPTYDSYRQVASCTYGGMLIPVATIHGVGFPNEDLVLYCDDTEYSYRIRAGGFKMGLVPDSVILDLEGSWSAKSKERETIFKRFISAPSQVRVRYRVRNSMYLARRWRANRQLVLLANTIGFGIGILLFGAVRGRVGDACNILSALYDGWVGRLGPLDGEWPRADSL